MNPQYYGAAADINKPKGPSALFNRKTLIIAGLVVAGLTLIMVVLAILGAIASGPRNDVARLTTRVQQLRDLLEKERSTIRHPDLKKVSAEARIYLATNALALSNAYGGELPDAIVASETDTTIKTKLDDATKAGRHDEEFLKIVEAKIALIQELSKKIQDTTSGQLTRAAATQTADSTAAISQRLDDISL